MTKQTRRKLIAILSMFLLTVALLEGGLRLLDPWGLLRAYADQQTLYHRFVADDRRGYHPQPGHYTFSNWTAEVLPDATRRVPDNNPSGCTVVFLGDSITFGMGVNDAETWVNLLARQLFIHAVNAGVYSYNTERVRDSLNAYPGAAVYVYLFFDNDADPDPNWQQADITQPALQFYLDMLGAAAPTQSAHTPGFAAALAMMRQRTLMVGFNTGGLSNQVGATLIPPYTHKISRADAHANAAGNREIAAGMLPIVQAAVDRACPVI